MSLFFNRKISRFLAASLLAGLAWAGHSPVQAATFTVANGDTAGLISALTTANGNNQADTINLAANGTYTLTAVNNVNFGNNGLPVIIDDLTGQDITINGNGATITRSTAAGIPSFRILGIAELATTSISNLKITNGKASGATQESTDNSGGGILSFGTLTLTDCTLSGNSAYDHGVDWGGGGGLASGGTLVMTGCTVSSNKVKNLDNGEGSGGGFLNAGTATLSKCVFSSNSLYSTARVFGGGIYSEGPISLTDCTLSSNSVGGSTDWGGGGAFYSWNEGAARIVALTNCTFNNNVVNLPGGGAGGAVYNDLDTGASTTIKLTNCTLAANTSNDAAGAIMNDTNSGTGVITLRGCTLSGNTTTNGGVVVNSPSSGGTATVGTGSSIFQEGATVFQNNGGGTVSSQGFNLCNGTGNGFLTAATDIKSTSALLGALQDNGGPTKTMALAANSPAIDKGNKFSVNTDQRGLVRPSDNTSIAAPSGGDNSDIGAYEAQVPLSLTLATSASSVAEGGAAITGTVTRTGATTAALTVTLSTSPSGQLTVPASVSIPAGAASATFSITAVNDTAVDGNVPVTITASATGFVAGTKAVTAADNEVAGLTVTTSASIVTEGGAAITGTVKRNTSTAAALTVTLAATPTNQLTLPASVTIAAGATSANFSITAVNDTNYDGDVVVTITASATGLAAGSKTVTAKDNELGQLTVTATPTSFAENAGAAASTGKVTRTGSTANALTITLTSSDTKGAKVPATITLAAGVTSGNFAIAAMDDLVADGTQSVTITATATSYAPGSVVVSVVDNDSKALRLSFNKTVASEADGSSAVTATVTRNTATTAALTVTLTSSATSVATVATSVVIPAGAASVTFPVNILNNTVAGGDQGVVLSASASGYLTGKAGLTVLDDELGFVAADSALIEVQAVEAAETVAVEVVPSQNRSISPEPSGNSF